MEWRRERRGPARVEAAFVATLALLAVPAVACLRAPLGDPDLWWHLATGEWILRHGRVPWGDPFSFLSAGKPWIAYSWLAEVGLHAAATELGFAAIIVARAAAAVAAAGLVLAACRATGARPFVAIVCAGLATLGTSGAWSERPQILTVVLLALLSWMLRSARGRVSLSVAAPLVLALWANVHVLFVAGLALLATAAAAATLTGKRSRVLWIATLLATAATLATPYGWHLHAHLPMIAAQPWVAPEVTEFRPPSPASLHGFAAAAMVAVAAGALAAGRRRPSLYESATFLAPLALAVAMARNVALFAVLAAPTLARLVEGALPPRAPSPPPGRARSAAHALLSLALVSLVAASWPRGSSWRNHVEPGAFPVDAVDFLEHRGFRGRIVNDFDSGGFLIYRLHPHVQVSIDGRTQVHGKQPFDDYARLAAADEGWRPVLRALAPDAILWPRGTPLDRRLRGSDEPWHVAYEDTRTSLFVPLGTSPHPPAPLP